MLVSVILTQIAELRLMNIFFPLVALGRHGEVFLEDNNKRFYFYKLKGDQYKIQWEKQLPVHVVTESRKYVTENGAMLVKDYRDKQSQTFTYDMDFNELNIQLVSGELIALLSNDRKVYMQNTHEVCIVGKDVDVTLRPPKNQKWSEGLSVCAEEDIIVIVDDKSKSMDIYTSQGESV